MSGLTRSFLVAFLLGLLPGASLLAEEAAPPTAPAPGPEHAAALAQADALEKQVLELHGQGKSAEAARLEREVLALREQALGKEHLDIATTLQSLAVLLRGAGALTEARSSFERALAIREKALGPDDPLVAESLTGLAALLRTLGNPDAARRLHERALAIREKALGREHPDVARSLGELALVYRDQMAYAEAQTLLERALAIREKAHGAGHLEVAGALNDLALVHQDQGRLAQARPLMERSLAIREQVLGKDHPEVAVALNNLGMLAMQEGAYEAARPLLLRALALEEKLSTMKTGGADHPNVAVVLNNLANVLQYQGAFAEARPLYERALAILERAWGKDHPRVATLLNSLALLHQAQGAYAEARVLYDRARAISERAWGPEHPQVAHSLCTIGQLLLEQGQPAQARPLLERALAIYEHTLAPDHPLIATAANNLALLLTSQGALAEARPHLERALGIYERTLGTEHPTLAAALHNLAGLLRRGGLLAEARAFQERALAIWERTLGKEHRTLAVGLNNLAVLLHAQGAHAQARPLQERALAIDEARSRAQLAALSGPQRLALMRDVRRGLDNWLDTCVHLGLSGHAEALRMRGIVARAEAAERALARHATGELRQKVAALQAATRRASQLANQPPAGRKPGAQAAWQEQYVQAAAERERLLRAVTGEVAAARTALERLDLTPADVQKALAPDGALVDLLRSRDRYLAWVLRRTGEAVRIELGAADAIDAACETFVATVARDPGDGSTAPEIARSGAELRRLVWDPLEAHLGSGVKRVVLCPDAALASLPFAALPGKAEGSFLGDELQLTHVFHPFDLVARGGVGRTGKGALVLGGVDFDQADAGATQAAAGAASEGLAVLDRAPRGGTFAALPATRLEAESLRARLGPGSTTLLLGAQATEARLRAGVKGKRLVHVATHGFARTDLLAGLYSRRLAEEFVSADTERQLGAGHDPMLLSGLALAGANARDGAGGDDGILTALEVSYLDLEGVELVTLSACETARGTAESGEGVLGLVSALRMAGARDVLASLWKVDDEATQRLMDGVYERLLRPSNPLTPAAALREAARTLRSWKDPSTGRSRFASPRYWAAFVAYGG